MTPILYLLYLIIGSYVLFYSLHWVILALASFFFRPKKAKGKQAFHQPIAVLFPAYNPNERLLEALEKALALDYSGECTVFVLLQKASPQITEAVKQLPVVTFEADFSQAKGNIYHAALRYFCKQVETNYQGQGKEVGHALLLDKDNLIAPDFLQEVMKHGGEKTAVWQGVRKSLSETNATAAYDGLSEKLNDVLLREGSSAIGAAPELSGSAALYRWEAFKSATFNLDGRAPGMDKNLMVQLLLKNTSFCYVPSAAVYEEKTEDQQVLGRQRVRWFGNQYFNAWYYGKKLIGCGTWASVFYAISLYRPPRSVQIVALPFLAVLEILFGFGLFFTLAFGFTGLGTLLFLLKSKALLPMLRVAVRLPLFAWQNLQSASQGSSLKQQGKWVHTERKI